MAFKPPSYAVQNIFSRVVRDVHQVKTSHTFVMVGKCPLCNDYKRRMYCKEYPDHFHVYCHNCGYSNEFKRFLRDEFPSESGQLNEFILDSIKTGTAFKRKIEVKKIKTNDVENDLKLRVYMEDNSFCLGETQTNKTKEKFRQISINYLNNRKILKDFWNEFRFFFKGPLKGYIGIPMWDATRNNLMHIQGRLLINDKTKEDQQKYLFLKDVDKGIEDISKPVYGTWRVDKEKTVYICEGTLDCFSFGSQGIATCGATISKWFINGLRKDFNNRVWCMDNYWTDKEGRKLTKKLLEMGESCFIIPRDMKSKDSNDLLKELVVDIIPDEFIMNNIYSGKTGIVKLSMKEK
jgi:hypothetical protein